MSVLSFDQIKPGMHFKWFDQFGWHATVLFMDKTDKDTYNVTFYFHTNNISRTSYFTREDVDALNKKNYLELIVSGNVRPH